MTEVMEYFSPALCRAARGMLGWSQGDLSERAHVARSTVTDFERGTRQPMRNNLAAMIRTLEEAGVVFLPPDGLGAGVRLAEE